MQNPTLTIDRLKQVKRGSAEWHLFVEWQKGRILERLQRYNNLDTVKTQLTETGNLSTYQNYKITVVSNFLLLALENLNKGNYGFCTTCDGEISIERLLLVPGALRCMRCETGILVVKDINDDTKTKK